MAVDDSNHLPTSVDMPTKDCKGLLYAVDKRPNWFGTLLFGMQVLIFFTGVLYIPLGHKPRCLTLRHMSSSLDCGFRHLDQYA